MSLEQLRYMAGVELDLNDPVVQARLELARQNQKELDRKLEQQVRDKHPSQELLNKAVDFGTRYP